MSKRKIGSDYGWILPLGVVVGGGAVLYSLWQKFGQSGNAANNATVNTANTNAAAASAAAASAAGINPTMNANQAANIANQVYTTGVAASGPMDLSTINNAITQVNNIADLNLVISAFGTKSIPSGDITSWTNMCLSLGINCTSVGLADFVRVVFAAYDPTGQYLENLNTYMSEQGINYTF
jgi:hypothetical protein